MNKTDEERFAQIMLGVADNFRDSITKEGMIMRFDMLKQFSIEQVTEAAKKIMYSRKYTKMPPIAEFIEAINGQKPSINDKALVIASEIIAHLRAHGSRIFPDLRNDKIAWHLMTRIWPYKEWSAAVIESELKWWTKEFCKAYSSYAALEETMAVPMLDHANKIIKQLASNITGKI